MRIYFENHKTITTAATMLVALSVLLPSDARATATLDSEYSETRPPAVAPPVVSPRQTPLGVEPLEETESMPDSKAGFIPSGLSVDRSNSPVNAGQPTYSIRLPLGVSGSTMPKLDIGKPLAPPSGAYMPRSDNQDYNRPVGWRVTAEAIRTQPASSSLIVSTLGSDFKTSYAALFSEAPVSGWNLTSLSLPAGHFLLRIPKSEADSSDDAAAWLVVLLSPIDAGSTEIRIKIQSRKPSSYLPAVSAFLKRCQMKASGNELL
jgi:hypothetical protein